LVNIARLAAKVWQDDHQDQLQGLNVAAFIIKNRVQAGWGSWRQMISKADQWAGNVPGPVLEYPNDNDPLFRQLLADIDGIYNGLTFDELTTATTFEGKALAGLYYADLSKPITLFLKEKIPREPTSHKRVATVGRLTIFP
jgi:hypothetical protein